MANLKTPNLSLNKRSNQAILLLIAMMLIIGGYFIFQSRAATVVSNIEAENGAITSPASLVNDASSSGGKSISFNSITLPDSPQDCRKDPDGADVCTLEPVGDTTVDSNTPTTNEGTATSLHLDLNGSSQIYLEFNLKGYSSISYVSLGLVPTNGSVSGANVKTTSLFDEKSLTYNNRPPSSNIVSTGQMIDGLLEFNVTSIVKNNNTYAFVVERPASTTSGANQFGSRENSNSLLKPYLNVVGIKNATGGGANCADASLKFCDDFSGAAGSAIDSNKWKIMSGASGWGVECFVNSPNNIAIDGAGNLKMTVRKETGCSSRSYTSGGVDTSGKFYFQYGKVEIRAKAACGGGVWPALWTSTGNNGPSWPNSGEIDILEIMDGDQFNAQQTLHGGPSHWQLNNSNKSSTRWCEAYHVYGIDWRQGSIKFTLDGAVKHTETPSNVPSGQTWPFDLYNQRILLDLQIGSWGGTINDADLPSSMLIDYIKIYP